MNNDNNDTPLDTISSDPQTPLDIVSSNSQPSDTSSATTRDQPPPSASSTYRLLKSHQYYQSFTELKSRTSKFQAFEESFGQPPDETLFLPDLIEKNQKAKRKLEQSEKPKSKTFVKMISDAVSTKFVGLRSIQNLYKAEGFKPSFRQDFIASLTVASLLIPQSMAYASLAGLSPVQGIYASIIAPFIYGFLGTSPSLSVAPVALVSLLSASTVSNVALLSIPGEDPELIPAEKFLELTFALAFLAGLVQVVLGALNLGALTSFLSHPVLSGFSSAAAILIGASQLKHLFGLDMSRHEFFYETLGEFFTLIGQTHWPTLLLGFFSVAFLGFFKVWKTKKWKHWKVVRFIPFPLVVLVLGALVILAAPSSGISQIGNVPSGFPPVIWPFTNVTFAEVTALVPSAFVVSLVGFLESIAVAKKFASQRPDPFHILDSSQELFALGTVDLFTSFFSGFAVTGGFSRSAVQFAAGSKTQVTGILTAILVLVASLLLAPLFSVLPKAGLAAIIMVAVSGLFDFHEPKKLWKQSRQEFWSLVFTFFSTLIFGIEVGILLGVIFSLAILIYQASNPPVLPIGYIPQTLDTYRFVGRNPEALIYPDILHIRIDGPLFFANADNIIQKIKIFISQYTAIYRKAYDTDGWIRAVVFKMSSVTQLDSSATDALIEFSKTLAAYHIQIVFEDMHYHIRDSLQRTGFVEEIQEQEFSNVEFVLSSADAFALLTRGRSEFLNSVSGPDRILPDYKLLPYNDYIGLFKDQFSTLVYPQLLPVSEENSDGSEEGETDVSVSTDPDPELAASGTADPVADAAAAEGSASLQLTPS